MSQPNIGQLDLTRWIGVYSAADMAHLQAAIVALTPDPTRPRPLDPAVAYALDHLLQLGDSLRTAPVAPLGQC